MLDGFIDTNDPIGISNSTTKRFYNILQISAIYLAKIYINDLNDQLNFFKMKNFVKMKCISCAKKNYFL